MTLSTLDPHVALIVIDLQRGVVSLPLAHPIEPIIDNAVALVEACRRRDDLVVLVNADATAPGRTDAARPTVARQPGWSEVIDELGADSRDVRVTKGTWGAFHETSLDATLRARAVTQVIVIGVATSAGVESTVRAAHEHGYHVVVVSDAITDRERELHDHSVARIFPRVAEVTTTAELLDALEG